MPIDIIFKKQKNLQQLTPEQQRDVAFVNDFYETAIELRRPFERQWYMNMAFFLGKQWVTWNNAKRQLEVPLAPSWRVRLVCNRIMPTVLHIVAKLSQNRPVYRVIPTKAESEALNDALTSERVLRYLHQKNSQYNLNQDLFMMMTIYGTAFKYPYFDAFAGLHFKKQKITKQTIQKVNPETGELETVTVDVPFKNEKGEIEFWDVYEGEVKEDVLDPFSILPEPGATDLENSFRVMKLTSRPIEYIRQRYAAGKFVQAEAESGVSSIENQLRKMMDDRYQTKSVSDIREKKGRISNEGFATIKELREKPSHKYPRGRYILVANGVLLHSGDLPYEFMVNRSTLGIVKYDYIKVPGRFWGKTPIEDLIPIQIELNKVRSQIIEIKNLMAKPKWIAYKESGISETSITSEPGEVVQPKYVPNVPEPHPVIPPPLPAYVTQEIDRNAKEIEEIGLIHEVSKGTTPPGIRSGVAIQFLQEQDQTVFGPVIARFEAQDAKSGTYLLELVKEKYKEHRILKIVGEDDEIEVFDFLAYDDMPTDVQVLTGSALPESKVAKQQLIIQAFQAGMFGDIRDEAVRRRALRLMEIGAVDALYKDIRADEKKAERENRFFERGKVLPIDIFDAHSVHIMIHDLFRKSESYRKIKQETPDIAEMIDAHVADHIMASPETITMQEQKALRERNTKAVEESMAGELAKDLAQAEHLRTKAGTEKIKQKKEVLEELRKEGGEFPFRK